MDAPTGQLVDRLLAVLRDDVLPLTHEGVAAGNKVFGAAVLRESDLALVIAGANEETQNPLFHGEISCLNRYWALPREGRTSPGDCLFLSSHEPCSLCLSAIAWSGFPTFYYLFSYEDTRDAFAIPHDLNILAEVFRCPDGSYAPVNAYWTSHYLLDLIEQGDTAERERRLEQVAGLWSAYSGLSDHYQSVKRESDIPLR